jgi:hypothetical protein
LLRPERMKKGLSWALSGGRVWGVGGWIEAGLLLGVM